MTMTPHRTPNGHHAHAGPEEKGVAVFAAMACGIVAEAVKTIGLFTVCTKTFITLSTEARPIPLVNIDCKVVAGIPISSANALRL